MRKIFRRRFAPHTKHPHYLVAVSASGQERAAKGIAEGRPAWPVCLCLQCVTNQVQKWPVQVSQWCLIKGHTLRSEGYAQDSDFVCEITNANKHRLPPYCVLRNNYHVR